MTTIWERVKKTIFVTGVTGVTAGMGYERERVGWLHVVQRRTSATMNILIEKNVMVPMRDGVNLATDVYRPAEGFCQNGKHKSLPELY